MSVHLYISPDPESTAQAAMAQLEAWGAECIEEQNRFRTSLAGGSTPRRIYELWAQESKLDWQLVELLFGDERCVPPDHPDSNYGMVKRSLLDRLTQLPHVHRMAGENPKPEEAAIQYERVLQRLMGEGEGLDVALLGMGGDGHTASLFPQSPVLEETERRCVATKAPDGAPRLTLTFAELREAERIMFLVVGTEKAGILREVLEGDFDPLQYPSQTLLRDNELETHLFLDEAAAEPLESEYEA